jgi:hypothetical protein
MVTCACIGIHMPNPRYALATTPAAASPIPHSVHSALKDPQWLDATQAEFDTLLKNQTWTLIDRLPIAKVISSKWVFKHKLRSDGSLERHRARWVVRGFLQRQGVNFSKTFTLIVKPAMIRTMLTMVASKG